MPQLLLQVCKVVESYGLHAHSDPVMELPYDQPVSEVECGRTDGRSARHYDISSVCNFRPKM